ncbi:MAG TPA: hypothetical protein PKC24_03210 [Cyclobacteriaceae bacterium]|nr:hypothetical protein [Cyclobacteriaceae bacterium]
MAKTTVKKAAPKAAAKPKAAPKKKASKVSAEALLEKAAEDALKKLQQLGIEEGLQADIKWCLGSYRHDKNPVGLLEMAGKSLKVFEAAKKQNAKAIPAKLINDLKKVLQ